MQKALPLLRRCALHSLRWTVLLSLILISKYGQATNRHTEVKNKLTSVLVSHGNVMMPPTVCTPPDVPTLSATATTVCKGTKVTLSIANGSLHNAARWHWYSGSCGGTSVGYGTSLTVTPSATTTYYVRGEGNCVTASTCASVTITVNVATSSTVNASYCNGTSYKFNGITYTAPGTYHIHLTNKAGCDSAITFNLKRLSLTYSTVRATFCPGKSYTFNGKTYTSSGTYRDTLTNKAGCDSIITLYLSYLRAYYYTSNYSICDGRSLTWHGNSYTSAGTYTLTYTDRFGCDSIYTLTLSVREPSTSTITASLCSGSSYLYNGRRYYSAGTYHVHFTNKAGCDSNVTLILKGNSPLTTVYKQICSGQSYTFNGVSYTTSGTHTATFKNQAGCDSVVTLHLTVVGTITTALNITICSGGSYTFNGVTYTSSGTHTVTYTSAGGCDSVVTLNLSIGTAVNTTVNASICPDQSYTFNGTNYTSATTASVTLKTAGGCDSIVTLNLSLLSASASTINASICPGQSYTFNGTNYTSATNTSATLQNAAGCDSVVTLNLTMKSTSSSTDNESICPGGTYNFNGTNYTTAGTATYTTKNAAGCDSVVTLNLTMLSASSSTDNESICPGRSYNFNGTTYTTAGTATYTTKNAAGCDSVITLNLTMLSASSSTDNESICPGGSYNFNGTTYTTAGTATYTTKNAVGCDSVVTLNLTVKSTSASTVNASICPGGSYNFNGTTYTTAGTATYTTPNAVGCDSVITLNLTILSASSSSVSSTICSNQTYSFNGSTYNTAGTYSATLKNSNGCDSVVTLTLAVNNTSSSSVSNTICSNQTYSFNGSTYNTAGTYYATLTDKNSCDSVVTLTLAVNNTTSSAVSATICSNKTYSFNGSTYNTAGTYTATLTNKNSCDSVVTLTLAVNNTSSSSVSKTICSNQTCSFNGATYNSAGTYTATLKNSNGCDSVVTLTLAVNNTSSSSVSKTICSNQTYSFNGATYNTAGTYTATLKNSNGCDSVVTLSLAVNNTSSSTVSKTICSNQTYSFNGSTYNTAGTYSAILKNSNGCDSVVTLTLAVNNTSSSSVSKTICSNQTYSFNGSTYNTAGTYMATLKNSKGCDSVVTLNLTVNNTSSSSVSATICSNQSYSFNGKTYSAAGTYTATLKNSNNCDSVVTLTLNVKNTSAKTISASVCPGSSYTYNGTSYSAGTYSIHFTNKVGCDSLVTLLVVSYNKLKVTATNTTGVNSSYNIVLKWNKASGPYTIYYAQMTNLGKMTSVTGIKDTTYTILNVNAGATYVFSVADQSCSNVSSNPGYINTNGGSCTTTAPSAIKVTPAYTSGKATWTGSGSTYQVFYQQVGAANWVSYPASSASYSFSSLASNTCYVMFVANSCSGVSGYCSAFDTFCTPKLCDAPTTVTISNIGCKGFTASWSAVSGVAGYQIYIQQISGTGAPFNNSYAVLNGATTYTNTALSPGLKYSVYLRSRCDATNGSVTTSNTATFTTLSTGCKDDELNSVVSNTNSGTFNVYPNPNNGQFTINLTTENTTDMANVQIINTLGQIVRELRVDNNSGSINTTLTGNNLSAGMYFVKVLVGSETYTSRIVVQK